MTVLTVVTIIALRALSPGPGSNQEQSPYAPGLLYSRMCYSLSSPLVTFLLRRGQFLYSTECLSAWVTCGFFLTDFPCTLSGRCLPSIGPVMLMAGASKSSVKRYSQSPSNILLLDCTAGYPSHLPQLPCRRCGVAIVHELASPRGETPSTSSWLRVGAHVHLEL